MLESSAQIRSGHASDHDVLLLPFVLTLYYFLDVLGPLVSGELTCGQLGYYEYQAEKDRTLIYLAVLLVINVATWYVTVRWYKNMMRALGPAAGRISRQLEALAGRRIEPKSSHGTGC